MNKLYVAGSIALALAAAFGAGVLAQPPAAPGRGSAPPPVTGTPAPVPASLGPLRISGVGITVADLDKQRAWYELVLGMHKVGQYPEMGPPNEFIMSMSAVRDDGPVIALLRGNRQPGATTYGRVILRVPNSDALAEHMRTHGVAARRVAAGAYFITDPEGNNIELYTPPPPPPRPVAFNERGG